MRSSKRIGKKIKKCKTKCGTKFFDFDQPPSETARYDLHSKLCIRLFLTKRKSKSF